MSLIYGSKLWLNQNFLFWRKESHLHQFSLIKVTLILTGATVLAFGLAVLAESMLAAIALVIVYVWSGERVFSWQLNLNRLKLIFKAGAPLVLSGTFVLINMQIDMVMLGELLSDEHVGIYSAATRISQVWFFIPIIVGVSIMRNLVQTKNRSMLEYRWKLQKTYDVLSFFGLILAVTFTFLSEVVG